MRKGGAREKYPEEGGWGTGAGEAPQEGRAAARRTRSARAEQCAERTHGRRSLGQRAAIVLGDLASGGDNEESRRAGGDETRA